VFTYVLFAELGVCAYCAQIAQFRNLRCALRLIFSGLRNLRCAFSKAICVFCNLRFKNNRANAQIAQTVLDYLRKCCNSVFVKVIVFKENVRKNRN